MDDLAVRAGTGFRLNGRAVQVLPEPGERLSQSLRERLAAREVKVGCNAGDCGACTARPFSRKPVPALIARSSIGLPPDQIANQPLQQFRHRLAPIAASAAQITDRAQPQKIIRPDRDRLFNRMPDQPRLQPRQPLRHR